MKDNTYVKINADNLESNTLDQIDTIAKSGSFQGLISIQPDAHLGKGSCIGFTGKFKKDRVIPNIIGVDIGCLDKDTEFLTKNGWKKISEYKKGDLVLQYCKETDKSNFTEPINYIVKDCDEFYHFKNSKGLDQMVSEEHKMLVFKGYKSKGYKVIDVLPKEFENFKLDSNYYNFKTSFNLNGNGIDLTDDEIKLDIMITADGCIKWKRETKHQIYLHFKKERKIQRAKEILNSLNIEFKETLGKDSSTHIYFFVDKKFNKDLSKYWNASKEQLKILSDECLLWDGHKGYRSYFSSTNKESADIVQFAFASNNIRAGISITKYDKENWKDAYAVTPTKNNIVGYNNNILKVKSKDGKKYCFTVPNGYFIARRNGKIFITGNCGVVAYPLGKELNLDFEEINKRIRESIPLGNKSRKKRSKFINSHCSYTIGGDSSLMIDVKQFYYKNNIKMKVYPDLQLGTLGGGNHFIEIAENKETNEKYLLIHSGSRNFGHTVATHYQNKAVELCKTMDVNVIKDLEYLPMDFGGNDYIKYMKIAQQYASLNRKIMVQHILERLSIPYIEDKLIESVHNFIGEDGIVRKGAISAYEGEKVIIPFNMSEGSIIGIGKGIKEYNYSAPHGAGRVSSRNAMKQRLIDGDITMDMFKDSMNGIYSSCVDEKRIDESKFAYKDMDSIMKYLEETVEIKERLIPIYNLKG